MSVIEIMIAIVIEVEATSNPAESMMPLGGDDALITANTANTVVPALTHGRIQAMSIAIAIVITLRYIVIGTNTEDTVVLHGMGGVETAVWVIVKIREK